MDKNVLYYGDNLDILRERIAPESVDLIYLDPPFNSKRSYNILFGQNHGDAKAQAQIEAFDDTWTWTQETERLYFDLISGGASNNVADAIQAMHGLVGENDVLAYLVMMAARLVELHRVLKPTGSLYLHCDPTASHYLKVMLDAVFGTEAYRNELIWNYGGRGAKAVAKQFPRNHDVIFMYRQTKEPGYAPQYERRTFTPEEARERGFRIDAAGRWFKTAPRGDYTDESIKRLDSEGRIHWTTTGTARIKYFLPVEDGLVIEDHLIGDVWSDIPDAMHIGSERLGYETQKPLALLRRIIGASSQPGDLVLDPFCGCGTTVIAAQELGRRWIGIDVTYIAVDLMRRRLEDAFPGVGGFEMAGIPRDLPGAQALFERSAFEFERWAVSLVYGQPNERQVGDRGSDGVIRFPMPEKNSVGRVVVSVKGGGQVGPTMIRDLGGTVSAEKAQMGVLITMTRPTPKMTEAAHHTGSYTWPVDGRDYPKLQIMTVEELLAGHRLTMPPPLSPYTQAVRQTPGMDQLRLG
jgi:DNA modification methylase